VDYTTASKKLMPGQVYQVRFASGDFSLKPINKERTETLDGNLWDILSVTRADELAEDDFSRTLKDCSPTKWFEKYDKGFLDYMVENYALYYEPILTSLNNNKYRIVFEKEGADEFVSQITCDDDGSVLWADIDAVISKMHPVGELVLLTLEQSDVQCLVKYLGDAFQNQGDEQV
jgi:hypothetical protein